jgi:hypothetical protein
MPPPTFPRGLRLRFIEQSSAPLTQQGFSVCQAVPCFRHPSSLHSASKFGFPEVEIFPRRAFERFPVLAHAVVRLHPFRSAIL